MKSIGQIFPFFILKTFTAIVFLITALFSRPVFAQFEDDFSDGDFSTDPPWQGDISDFIVKDGELTLNAGTGQSSAYLATENKGGYGSWDFTVRMGFNPSGSNFTRVFLTSTSAELNGNLEGYFVAAGGSSDEISLYRQSGTARTKIIDGNDGRLDLSLVSVRVKVTRDSDGNWELFSKLEAEPDFRMEGATTDNSITSSTHFGIECVFTSTRADKFQFDDFAVNTFPPVDSTPPQLSSVSVIDSHKLHLTFTESIQPEAAMRPATYLVSPDIGNPEIVEMLPANNAVILEFRSAFINGTAYTLQVGNIVDFAGNSSGALEVAFVFAMPEKASAKDVILTEIFPDPSPVVGLPEAEFAEIYNRSGKVINLENWTVSDGTGLARMGQHLLLPGQYLILCASSSGRHFEPFGVVLTMPSFPSLNNSGDALIIKDETGLTIDSILYSDDWYKSSTKKSGGWTLELIDPDNICAESENWIASENEKGGTPGTQNSVFESKPDLTGPRLIQAIPLTLDSLSLQFNEKLEAIIPPVESFHFNERLTVERISLMPGLKDLILEVSPPFVPGKHYTIEVSHIFDCAGNPVQSLNSAEFGLPETADSLDVVINEILFNPRPNGVDFVEVVNRSGKFIDLKNWKIANFVDDTPTNSKPVTSGTLLLRPKMFLALTPDEENIRNEYPASTGNLFGMALPSFNDDSGSVCLISPEGKIIDALSYHAGMHSRFVRDKEGVSLERIFQDRKSNDPANWRSASSHAGFATPGLPNTNEITVPRHTDRIKIQPEIFIPTYGQPDFATIEYTMDQGNYMANIRIFDAFGRVVKTITENSLLGSAGFFRWDGDRDDGTRARVGSYMVRIELFNTGGVFETIMKRVVIAGRF